MLNKAILTKPICGLLLAGLLACAGTARAYQTPSSDLLLPYFEVDLTGAGVTTLFTVGNYSTEPVPVRMTVYSNWGIEVLRSEVTLEGKEVKTVNLSRWLIAGELFDKNLNAGDLEHVQAALSGQRSSQTGLYYSTELAWQRASGFVTIRTIGGGRPDALFGDYFIVDPAQDLAQGLVLVNIDPNVDCESLCRGHILRFLAGGGFDGGSEVLIWTNRINQAADSPFFPEGRKIAADALVYNQAGELIDQRQLHFLPQEVVKVSDLGLTEPFGWLDLITAEPSFITVRYTAESRFSVGLHTFCVPPPEPNPPGGRIRIEKSTNGHDADLPPGPRLGCDAAVVWEYMVTNSGGVPLSNVTVTDNQGVEVSCPRTSLAKGQSMTCTGTGTAEERQYANVGTATGTTPDGDPVTDSDPSHYHTDCPTPIPRIEIEKATNGEDADDLATAPKLVVGDPVTWTYVVTNPGPVDLTNVTVTDNMGVTVHCPGSWLAVGSAMTCTGNGIAQEGDYQNVGTATGFGPSGQPASDSDPSHYHADSPDPIPRIEIEKSTNGEDADDPANAPQVVAGDPVTWTYVVTNPGPVDLINVTVTDSMGVTVHCPGSSLAVDSSMTCTGSGVAVVGQYMNVGTGTGEWSGIMVSDSDPSHYFGVPAPLQGRMTGGGSVFEGGERFTHGFELHCDTSRPNNLEINWGKGERFHLSTLDSATCSDDPSISPGQPAAGFDTFIGSGTGKLNGQPGATIEFKFTDAGEPGKQDLAEFRIVPPDSGPAIVVSGTLKSGNHQAH